jgi:hypothetical protein
LTRWWAHLIGRLACTVAGIGLGSIDSWGNLMRLHFSSGPRARRWRSAIGGLGVIALLLSSAGIAMADTVVVESDTLKVSTNVHYGATSNPANHACSERGNPVSGSILIAYNNTGTNPKHYQANEQLTVTITNSISGITVTSSPASPTMPSTWADGSTKTLGLSTTVATSVPNGSYTIDISVTGAASGVVRDDSYQVIVDCAAPPPVNTVPSVAFSSPPTSADEGSATTFAFAITDPDAGDSWSFASGYPDCGAGTVSDQSIDSAAKTGTFKCTFPDGVVPAVQDTVKVKVVDAEDAASNEATTQLTINNVVPTVAAPAFASSSVDCRNSVTLSGISFSDPGADAPWDISIDWGDGSPHTTYDASAQGAQGDQSHTYNAPGNYSATVTVTDKDSGQGSNTSSNQVTVNQVYTTDFLPPFDDSTPSGLIVNQMKNGRVVPVKAAIYDVCTQAYVTSPAVVTIGVKKTSVSGTPTPDAVESYADAGASSSGTNLFRWNADTSSPTGGFWIYNLDSKALALATNSYYRVDIYVGGVQATKSNWGVLQPVK